MTAARTVSRIEKAVWIAIYGGLFLLLLGLATGKLQPGAAWTLSVIGIIAVAAGVILIWVRSRLTPSKGNP